MENLKKTIKEYNPNIADSSIRIYALNITKLYRELGGEGDVNVSLFKKTDEVLKHLDDMKGSDNTKKNKLSSIITYLLASKIDKDIVNKYSNKIATFSDNIEKVKSEMKWSVKEEKNILSVNDIETYVNLLKSKLPTEPKTYKDFLEWMHYLVSAFHINFPLRNDLGNAEIYSTSEFKKIEPNKDTNYLIINSKDLTIKVILNKYKTKKTYGVVDFQITDKELVADFIKYYKLVKPYVLAYNNGEYDHSLFFDKDFKKFSSNEFSRFFEKAFNGTGKHITTTMIRKIVVSNLYDIEKMKKLAYVMGHSLQMQLSDYSKQTVKDK
jgi:hypothetical protein